MADLLEAIPEFKAEAAKTNSDELEISQSDLFSEGFSKFLKNGKYFDVIIVHEGSGREYYCHRMILANSSFFFDMLFSSHFLEKKLEKINVKFDDPENIFPNVIEYLYQGKTKIAFDKLVSFRLLADQLMFPKLSESILKYMKEGLNNTNVLKFFQTGIQKKDDKTTHLCIEYIAKNFVDLQKQLTSDEFVENTPAEIIFNIIGHPYLIQFNPTDPIQRSKAVNALIKICLEKKNILSNKEMYASAVDSLLKAQALTTDDAVYHLWKTEELGLKKQAQGCVEIIAKYFSHMSEIGSKLMELTPSSFLNLINSDNLQIQSEDKVWSFCYEYIKHNRNTLDDETAKKIIGSVRICFLSSQRLNEIVKLSTMLNNSNSSQIKAATEMTRKVENAEGESNSQKPQEGGIPTEEENEVLEVLKLFPPNFMEELIDHLFVRLCRLENYPLNEDTLKPNQKTRKCSKFVYESDFDTKGILYWLGTLKGTESWKCPLTRNLVDVDHFPGLEAGTKSNLIGRTSAASNLLNQANGWVSITFNTVLVNPSKYTVRHTNARDAEALRNWSLQGSNDKTTWTDIDVRNNDATLNVKDQTATFTVSNPSPMFFKHLRIFQHGMNSSNSSYLSLAGLEFYGDIIE